MEYMRKIAENKQKGYADILQCPVQEFALNCGDNEQPTKDFFFFFFLAKECMVKITLDEAKFSKFGKSVSRCIGED